ncbi:phosphate ABC transporter permease protein PstA [Clostridium sp. CAG:1013]|nr:phosphate ABC transporter permease protein PstA [Clostridium sp. CAG:1013]
MSDMTDNVKQTKAPSQIEAINKPTFQQALKQYRRSPFSLFLRVIVTLAAIITVAVLLFLVAYIVVMGVPNLRPSLFALEYNSENASLLPALINTVIMTFLSLLAAVPVGIFSAIYLVEYAKRGNKLVGVVRITAETLSGIPSIVYGLFGFLFFGISFGWGYSMLGGALTMAIMILPLVMRTTEEALMSVPDSFREGSFGLGAGKLRTVFRIILPSAMPGILSGIILGVGRIVGETAALMFTSGTVAQVAVNPMQSGRTLAVHMYNLLNEGLGREAAYATAVVLLVLVIGINALSSFVAKKFTKA